MSDGWVINASPIITLAKVGHLELIEKLAPNVGVPPAVVEEIVSGSENDPGRLAIERGWGKRLGAAQLRLEVLGWSLGPGESEVLSIALGQTGWTAVVDDATARSCARSLGIPVIGTLGVVLRGKRRGLIDSAAEVIRGLRRAGLYLDDGFVRDVLEQVVGENWQPE